MIIDRTFIEICVIEDLSPYIDKIMSKKNYAVEIDWSDVLVLTANKIVEELVNERESESMIRASQ